MPASSARRKTFGFALALLAVLTTTTAEARTFHVSTTGSDGGDGSAASPWRTLTHAAVQTLLPGDTVLIEPGTYHEDVALTRSGAEVVPVTTGVTATGSDTLRFPAGTDLSGIDLAGHAGEYYLYVYRSWRMNNGVFPVVETGSDAAGPWLRVGGADFIAESGAAGDPTRLSAAVGRPVVFRNASADPDNERVLLDASTNPSIYTILYIGDYLDYDDANPVDWVIVDGIDTTGSHQGGGVHIQDSSFNVVMNSRIHDLQGAGILIAGNDEDPARYNLVWNNLIYNTPDEGVYVGAGGHGPDANHAYYTHVVGNDITTVGNAANASLENAVDLKEHNIGDLVAGNLLHDFDLITGYNGAIDIRDGKRDVLIYNNVLKNIGRANSDESSVIHLYAGSDDIVIVNNLLVDDRPGGSPVYAFNVDGGGSEGVLIAHNTVSGLNEGLLLEHYGGTTGVRFTGNIFDFTGGIEEWGNGGRFQFDNNLYTSDPGAYAGEPGRLVADPLWVDPAGGDFRLQAASPALDSAAVLAEVTIDLDRLDRPSGAGPDRGAYELAAAPQPPAAAFTAAPVSGVAPLTVSFTDQSGFAPTAWSWDFGDGGSSADQHPSHDYASPGSYSVTLTVTNAEGSDSLTRTGLIQVAEPVPLPAAGFTASPTTGEAPLAVQFTDLSSDATSWSWEFGDGARSTAASPGHTYAAAGDYTVVQTVGNAAGSDSLTRVHYIQATEPLVAPTAAFAATPTGGYAPLTVQFSDQSAGVPTSWSWDFGDGSLATEPSPSHAYTDAGSYSVTLTVANAEGSDSLTIADLVTVSAPGSREAIFFDGFETGLDAWWTDGNVSWSDAEPKIGSHAMRFTGNNIWTETWVSTAGYEQIRIAFYAAAESFEDWEYLILYWTDGQTWYEPVEITNQHPAAGNTLTLVEVDLPAAAADNPDFGLAFGMWDTDTGDIATIDDVLVSGVPLAPPAPADPAGETGSLTLTGNWDTQPLTAALADPVIIAGVPGANDPDPGVLRLRNVGADGFEARFEEWNYLDRDHGAEQAAWLALAPGRYTLADGSVWEVGRFDLNGTRSWKTLSFSAPFADAPALLLTAQTANGGQTVTVRAKAVTGSGFKAALYEQESLNDGHTTETIGYLAIHQPAGGGSIGLGGARLDYAVDSVDAGHDWTAAGAIELRVEEERSADSETNHVAETLSVLELDGGHFAQDVTTIGGNTAAPRMR